MRGTGGIRKLRYAARTGQGKSGGARVIYLAVAAAGHVYLLDIFAKNDKENLSTAERQAMAKVVTAIKDSYHE